MAREIPLTQGKVALVDDADYGWLSQWKWRAQRNRHTFYAVRSGPRASGSRPYILMHRLIAGQDDPKAQVDHLNQNGLDNQRANLRSATHAQNQRNRTRYRTNTSGYKGVILNKSTQKWEARIKVNGKGIYLGLFADPADAARAYDEAAIKYHGEFAHLNEATA